MKVIAEKSYELIALQLLYVMGWQSYSVFRKFALN